MQWDKAFLYSRNGLNVAVSRGRCLAVVVASVRLLEARCAKVEEIGLVNLLCLAAAQAQSASLDRSSIKAAAPLP